MTSSQLILVAVTSALISVFTMLFVATLRRARTRDDDELKPVIHPVAQQLMAVEEAPAAVVSAPTKTPAKKTPAKKTTAKKTTAKKATSKKTPARKAPATRKKR
ncbi:MAG TPA: hypothetical protein VNC78_08595 [Actinomycetota bacterium]|nr:hypothetical protein [Actinomycetota bacterium]